MNPAYGTATVALARILHIEKGYEEEESALQANLAHAGTGVDADVATVGGGRESLEIPADKIVVYFHTDSSVNDWGYKMFITPVFPGGGGLESPLPLVLEAFPDIVGDVAW